VNITPKQKKVAKKIHPKLSDLLCQDPRPTSRKQSLSPTNDDIKTFSIANSQKSALDLLEHEANIIDPATIWMLFLMFQSKQTKKKNRFKLFFFFSCLQFF